MTKDKYENFRDRSVKTIHFSKSRFILAGLLLVFVASCSDVKQPVAEAPPAPQSIDPANQPQQAAKLPPAQVNEVEEAVKRVFVGAAVIDTSRKPNFTVGDFNGDLSEDLAVVLKPAPEKLADLNQELPTWILRDLSRRQESNGPRLRVGANDVLLAVIHGYGAKGWREKEATQTFLLKNAVGSGLATQSSKSVANEGKSLPQLRGDVIGQEVGGTPGFLYYTRASYAWYDSKTFKGDEPERGMIHTARNAGTKR